jgi:GMP synthase-like glutamine amidotransferase
MRIAYLQHVPHEGPGTIADWAAARGIELEGYQLYRGAPPPAADAADALAVMGGPMSIHDEAEYPWLVAEKRALRAWIDSGKSVLGVCLGGQLIAQVLGATVGPNPQREIGWFPVRLLPSARPTSLGGLLPDEMEVFHWHGETFAIPAGALPLMSSAACDNQGFLYGERVLGLQCHLEVDPATVRAFIDNSGHSGSSEPYVQSAQEMLARAERFEDMRERMYRVLDWWAGVS